jgi:uroporphyrin-III C-methyltransferase / precorrin-2 dehydrogenase / sirohydrochlorin ferrochelatase
MRQLPIFVTLDGQQVIVIGSGDAATAKRRLVERAGGLCVDNQDAKARLAFVALEDADESAKVAFALKERGLLVNVVDRPELCDFTTPAIVDRDPVLIAVGTGGASAGLAKALRQRMETLLPQGLGRLANALFAARMQLRDTLPDPRDRRQTIDHALAAGGRLDPLCDGVDASVTEWLSNPGALPVARMETVILISNDPDDLTLRTARLLGSADMVCAGMEVSDVILDRARADAIHHRGIPPQPLAPGLTVHLLLPNNARE